MLITKTNKDPNDPWPNRPIYSVNQDAKIFTAVLAKKLNNFITKYIFLKRSIWFYVKKTNGKPD